ELVGVRREQAERLIGGPEDLDARLAARRVLERLDPVDGRVRGAVLGISRPGQDRQRALAVSDAPRHARRGRAGRRLAGRRRLARAGLTGAGRARSGGAASATGAHEHDRDGERRQDPPLLHLLLLLRAGLPGAGYVPASATG